MKIFQKGRRGFEAGWKSKREKKIFKLNLEVAKKTSLVADALLNIPHGQPNYGSNVGYSDGHVEFVVNLLQQVGAVPRDTILHPSEIALLEGLA